MKRVNQFLVTIAAMAMTQVVAIASDPGLTSVLLGNGTGYGGAEPPPHGRYYLIDPGFSCENGFKPGYRKLIEVEGIASLIDPCTGAARKIDDNEINFSSSYHIVGVHYDEELLSYQEGIFERNPDSNGPARIWCVGLSQRVSFEIVIRASDASHPDHVTLVLEDQQGQLRRLRKILPFKVMEVDTNQQTAFQREGFKLQASSGQSEALLNTKVDGVNYSAQLRCNGLPTR